jgi:hypothetical protein
MNPKIGGFGSSGQLSLMAHIQRKYFDNVRLRRIFTLFLQPAGGRAGTIDEVLGHQLSG